MLLRLLRLGTSATAEEPRPVGGGTGGARALLPLLLLLLLPLLLCAGQGRAPDEVCQVTPPLPAAC